LTTKYPLTLLLFCLFGSFLSAQQDYDKVKFGKIDPTELALMEVPGDSTAEAYVLYDILNVSMENSDDGTQFKEFHHRRVKLLTESSFERADIQLSYNNSYQKIFYVKAIIHFPDGSSTKLSKKDIIRESYDDDIQIYKFTFPGVREGCIIEYSWVKTDENITVPSRYFFQEDIPVRHAEYQSLTPYYFNYVSLSNGLNKYAIDEVNVKNDLFAGQGIQHTKIRWAMKDLPAYKEQPYVNNFSDYIPQVRMQLQSYTSPNGKVTPVFSDWVQTTKDLDERSDFGRAWRVKSNGNKVFKEVELKLAGKTTEREKAQVIYDFVTGNITWNGDYRITSDDSPNRVYTAATGSSAEMSLMLLSLLNQANIKAKPLLVPLRNRGGAMEIYPLISQFGHLMVLATLDGEEVMLDPGSIHRPMGLPRTRALNHRAFVADVDNPHWMNVDVPRSSQTVLAKVELDAEGMATVGLQSRLKSYYAFDGREDIEAMEEDGDFPLMGDILEIFPEAEMVSHEIPEEEEESGPLSFTLSAKVPMGQQVDDFLYVQPILCPVFEKELADVEQRLYPVDFGYPWQKRYISTITIPEGYAVEELPESLRLTSQDRTMVCTFAMEDKGQRELVINFTVSVKKTVYKAEEYVILREMFRRIIDLQETTFVLKRAK